MQFTRLNTIALAVFSAQAAVLPRQDASSSPLTSLPNTSATSKSYLTSITSLPMPSSVEGNTAYPPSTTSLEVTSAAAPTSIASTPSSPTSFPWNAEPAATNATTSSANLTTSSRSPLTTGSATNLTASGINSTLSSVSDAITSISSFISSVTASGMSSAPSAGTGLNRDASSAPYANSTTSVLVGGVAATGTAVVVTGVSAANATSVPVTSAGNVTVAAPSGSTSMIVQMYLSIPTTTAAAAKKASATEIDLGSNMTLVVEDEPSTGSAARATLSSSKTGTVALFANGTSTSGVARATGTGVSTTFASVTVKASASSNSTLPAATGASSSSSSTKPSSTGSSSSSPLVANAVDSNGTMFAVTYDNKNGTIVQLVPASNATEPLAATGTAAPSASASANLDRREAPPANPAPITPAKAEKGSWSKFAYARTEGLPRPSRFFSGEGWSFRRWS